MRLSNCQFIWNPKRNSVRLYLNQRDPKQWIQDSRIMLESITKIWLWNHLASSLKFNRNRLAILKGDCTVNQKRINYLLTKEMFFWRSTTNLPVKGKKYRLIVWNKRSSLILENSIPTTNHKLNLINRTFIIQRKTNLNRDYKNKS